MDTLYNWNDVPSKFNFIALDADDELWAYESKPKEPSNDGIWISDSDSDDLLLCNSILSYKSISYIDSLEERPAYVPFIKENLFFWNDKNKE